MDSGSEVRLLGREVLVPGDGVSSRRGLDDLAHEEGHPQRGGGQVLYGRSNSGRRFRPQIKLHPSGFKARQYTDRKGRTH